VLFNHLHEWNPGDDFPLVRLLQHAPKCAQGVVCVGGRRPFDGQCVIGFDVIDSHASNGCRFQDLPTHAVISAGWLFRRSVHRKRFEPLASLGTVELLPPQVQLSGTAKQKHHKAIKAEPVAVKDYRMTSRRLPPGATTEGTVVFGRPAFKESREQLLLQIAQAEEVDRPVLAPIAFVAPAKGAAK
jgi:hypothetical protein